MRECGLREMRYRFDFEAQRCLPTFETRALRILPGVRIVAAMSSYGSRGAVFLDRDGTIIQQVELMCQVRQLRLLPGAANAIRLFNEKEIPVLIVTNQPVVARGTCTEDEVELIHDELKRRC